MRSRPKEYAGLVLKATQLHSNRIVLGIPVTGLVRIEWVHARYGQIIPCNWSHAECHQWLRQDMPHGFAVAEARNLIVDKFIKSKAEWLFFIDHDVILPPDCFVKMNQYMIKAKQPVVAGLYFAKCHPAEPLLYRGRGNGYYGKWTLGDKVWVDGIPMGCTLIHRSLLEPMWNDAEDYTVGSDQGRQKIRKVFDTPAGVIVDPQIGIRTYSGTEDLAWCNRVIAGGYLKKSAWPDLAKQRYPFLVDTSMVCRHVTPEGQIYPLRADGRP